MIEIKNKSQIEKMRVVGKLAADTLMKVGELISPGITGLDIDNFVKEDTKKKGGICAPLNYKGTGTIPFPAHCCITLYSDSQLVHGIPSEKSLNNCIINVDITTIFDGYHGDCNQTFIIGNVPDKTKLLVQTTKECLNLGIQEVSHGKRFGDIGAAIQSHAESKGFFIAKNYTGHGIGTVFHMEPYVFAFGERGTGPRMLEGMTFTIEPILCSVEPETFVDEKDGWTVFVKNKGLSSQFEKTVLVKKDGVEILTDF